MPRSNAGRPRRPLRPGEDPAKVAVRRLRDLTRYYEQDPKLRWARSAVQNARRRAMEFGLAFAITASDVLSIAPTHCPALEIALDYSRGRITMMDDSATLDRLIPKLGYVPGNIAVISAKANGCKGRATPEEIMAVSRWATRALTAAEVVAIT